MPPPGCLQTVPFAISFLKGQQVPGDPEVGTELGMWEQKTGVEM